MPVCPQCTTNFHHGAEELCPACGYQLELSRRVFGEGLVDFPRVLDAAGALTHAQRQSLIKQLESLERRISPVALGIYITDRGQQHEFRPHAHWILNHCKIHHPSFGRRNRLRSIDESLVKIDVKRKPGGERRTTAKEIQPSKLQDIKQRCTEFYESARAHFSSPIPPASQEWLLILVIDIQLETACFCWGYELDAYLSPDTLTGAIRDASFQFRERDLLSGIRRVMKKAVDRLASRAVDVNRQLRKHRKEQKKDQSTRSKRAFSPMFLAALLSALSLGELGRAQNVSMSSYQTAAGSAASLMKHPSWSVSDYKKLMAGELWDDYKHLFSDLPQQQSVVDEAALLLVAPQLRNSYKKPSHNGLIDPQQLLTGPESEDVENYLGFINAKSRYKIYVSLFAAQQEVPQEIAAPHLVTSIAPALQYALLLQIPLGNPEAAQIAFREIHPSDAQRQQWLRILRQELSLGSNQRESVLRALSAIVTQLAPMAAELPIINKDRSDHAAPIDLPLRVAPEVVKKKSWQSYIQHEELYPIYYALASLLLSMTLLALWHMYRYHSARLMETKPDVRLRSPYGASVSYSVRYREGRDSKRDRGLPKL